MIPRAPKGCKDGRRNRSRTEPTADPHHLGDDSGGGDIRVTDLPLDILRKRLVGMRGSGPNYTALCPAHRDTRPSLAVTELPNAKVLVYCHAACPVENVLAALGLKLCHLFPSGYARQFNARAADLCPTAAPPARAVEEPDIDHARFRRIVREARAAAGRRLYAFAGDLGVTVEALNLLRVGVANGRAAFPERDDRRRPVGVCYRSRGGRRSFAGGGKRGLSIPHEQPTENGPLYVAEGGTDTAALLSAGVRAIGRPAAKVSPLATLWLTRYLERQPGRVVVLGDNDGPDGGEGLGRVAAKGLAAELAERLGRRVLWALPRPGFKDVRDQVAAGEWSRGVQMREVWA
jgi:hypothetical protein